MSTAGPAGAGTTGLAQERGARATKCAGTERQGGWQVQAAAGKIFNEADTQQQVSE